MNKKVLAIFLTLMICLNLLPVMALADTMDNIVSAEVIEEESGANMNTESESEDLELEKGFNLQGGAEDLLIKESAFEEENEEQPPVEVESMDAVDGETSTKPELKDGVYQIAKGEHLAWFAELVNGTLTDGTLQDKGARAVLTSDILLGDDSSTGNWIPIGNFSNQYVGIFDGEGHTVSGLSIDISSTYQGLFGYIGSAGVVKNVTVEGNISTKSNYAGGIAGYNAGTIEDCCNKATITSTQKYIGGITGSNYGTAASYATITGCYNAGKVKGNSYVGGIAGQNRNADISSSYNLGEVEPAGSNTGGIVGYGYTGTISSCYNVGTVKSTGTTNVGAVIGFLYKSSSTVLEKAYYLEGTSLVGIGNDGENTNVSAKSSDNMKTDNFVADLGGSFVADTIPNKNNGYPILGWQDPNAKYIVAFEVDQENAEVVVKNSQGNPVAAEAGGIYKLSNGTYSYTVSKDEFKTVESSFNISNGGKKITTNLEIKTYVVTFGNVSPAGSKVVVKDSTGAAVNESGLVYHLPKGSYTYTVAKFGYKTEEGSFTVNGTEITIPEIVLAESSRSTVTFDISFIDNNPQAIGMISVKHGEDVQEKNADGSYSLADGEYAYAIACNGYKTVMGNITVKGEAVHIQKTMEIRIVWSGTAEEPSTISKDGKTYYQIANGENLAWFCNYVNAGNVTANAVVTGNIVLSDEEQDNTWTSIGSYSKQYAGTFDGQGYKITGLKGPNGLFAYSNTESCIKNVAVEGIITQASSNIGGIMGANYGSISNCSFRGSIVSTGQRVGGIAGNNVGGTIENCANYADIKASTTYYATELDVGGIAGQSSGSLKNCYNLGAMTGSCPGSGCGEIGGITGKSTGTIQNCYSTGNITKEKDSMGKIGAVAGASSGSVSNCYYLTGSFSTGLGSGTGDAVAKTAAEIKDENFVIIMGGAFNKDYSGDKAINKEYPVLKWQGGLEVGGNANVEAVAADRNALQLEHLIIEEAGSLNLPVTGEHGTTISWSSSNTEIITHNGLVTLPLSGSIKVTLTAAITKGSASDTKQFELTVKSLDEATRDYLDRANSSLNSSLKVLSPVFGNDANVITMVQEKLNNLGFSGITVTIADSVDERYIASNGDITYFYIEPELSNSMNFGQVNGLKFTLSKGQQNVNYSVNAIIRWDRDKVIQTMTEQIADKLTFDLIKEQNTDINAVTKNLTLPQQVNGKAWATISWKSNSTYVNIVKNNSELFGNFTGEVTRPLEDINVNLDATITFNKTSSGSEEEIVVNKTFNLVLQGDNSVDWPVYMQEQLTENYTIDKLKVSSRGEQIDPENVTEDIQLLTARNTGIENYNDYKFTASSSDPNSVKINGYRAIVYRPLPGDVEKTVTLTISMQRKNTDITVTKDFTLNVQPLTQEEINKEITLMERVKANYSAGILDGMNADQVTKNLHAFKECYLGTDNNLVWVYDISECTDNGIEPYDLPKEGYDESYNLYHSSKPKLIQHENLVLASTPDYDTEVVITSNLQSSRFAKYAEKYPDNGDLKKLVNQLVKATVIVKGSKGTENPNEGEVDAEANVMIKAQAEGAFLTAPQNINVAYNLAESYGYIDEVENHVSALDALVKEHELIFGEAFTKETKNDYLQVGANGNISVVFGIKTSNNGFSVNGKAPNDEIYNETYQGYTGYTVNQAQIKAHDIVDFFIYGDATGYSDYYTWFEEGNEIEAAASVPFYVSLKGFCFAYYGMKDDNEIKKKTENISGAQLSLVNENGALVAMENVVTDSNGKARLTLPAGTYYITASRESSTPMMLPLSKLVVVAGETLSDKKASAIEELTNYKNSSEYREAQQQELETAIIKGKASINNAETFEQVKEALTEAKKEIDEIKTDAQLTIEERVEKEQEAYNAIYESLKAYKGGIASGITITIPYTGTESEIESSLINLYLNVLFEHPELFYVRTEYQIEIEGKGATIRPSIIEDFRDNESLTIAKNKLWAALDSAAEKCIFSDMSDLEKLLALHDWLVERCQYNKVGHLTGAADKINAYTAYGALVDGDAVCQGYSMALNLLLQKAGVASHYVSGNGHSWNVVNIAGNWYHVDSTWADETPDRPGKVKHNYFLLSDEEIKDQNYHSKWTTRYDIKCAKAYTGDTPWKTSTLPFVYDSKEKVFFNVENHSSTTQYRKIGFDAPGSAEVCVLQNLTLKNILAQIEYEGILYLVDNTGDVYAYDLKNRVKKLILDETVGIEPGYGLLIRDEKLIIRANYADVEELELYKEEPVSNKASRVTAFLPAPGQFVNKTEMLYNAYPNPNVTLENPLSEKVVSLGAYGGYIVYEFDKPITNNPNNPYGIDFIVYGNAGNGKSEPGAVMVSNDGENWYELAGSEYYNADTKKNLAITYTNPDTSFKEAVDVPWTTSDEKTGYIYKNGNHTQAYYPDPKIYNAYNKGAATNSKYSNSILSFVGNKINTEETPSFGYADCHKMGSDNVAVNPYTYSIQNYNGDGMDLDWAIDKNGNLVQIDSIKYIKIYTAVLEDNGIMGESSSEVAGVFAAQSQENPVGKTDNLKKLEVNGEVIALIDGKYNYVYDATDLKSLMITATGNSTDNIFINNKRVNSGTSSEPLALADKVRIIVQNGEKEPIIYIVNIIGANIEDNSENQLNNYLSDLIVTKLPDKTVYKLGESLNTGGIAIKAKYISNGAIVLKDINTIDCTIEGFDSKAAGTQNVKVSYYEDYYDTNNNFIKRINTSAIFVINVIDEKQEIPIEKEQSVILTIKGAKGKTWTSSSYVINPGVTSVMDALKAVLALNGTTYTIKAGGKYVSSIDGLGEFDLGRNSGWMVKVNDYLIDVSAADWKLNGGEKILWFYTEDWTKVSGTKGWKPEETVTEEATNAGETTTVSSKATAEAKTDSQGKASTAIGAGTVKEAIAKVLKEAEMVKKQGITANKEVIIEVRSDSKANSVETIIPQAAVAELHNSVDTVKLSTTIGELSFDNDALKTLGKEKGDVKLTVAKKDAEAALTNAVNISEKTKEQIKKGQSVEVSVIVGTKKISQFESNLVIKLPYKKLENQKKEAIVAYEINHEGLLKPIISGKMEEDGEIFKITANHCSTYIIAYNDVNFMDTQKHWADSNITYLAAREVIKGMAESTFEPDANITRAQFIQILANMSGADLSKYEDSKFNDVNRKAWFSKSAAWAADTGLAIGYSNSDGTTSFNPNDNITRQDMAVILSRYMLKIKKQKLSEVNKEMSFTDRNQIDSYAEAAIKELQRSGIINGKTSETFVPKGNATRAECSKMISVLMQNYL